MQTKKWLIGVIVILVVLWGAYLLMTNNSEAPVNTDEETVVGDTNDVEATMPVPGTDTEEMVVGEESAADKIVKNIVTYKDTGFTPTTLTVKLGESVTFTNSHSSRGMWVASASHPTHEIYPAFNQLKPVSNGGEYTFIFDKVGEWKYHNHVGTSDFGTIIVQ